MDVSSSSAAVDAATATYNLSGWLGGWQADADRAALAIGFLGADGGRLGSAQIGAVTWTDRNSVTELLQRKTAGTQQRSLLILSWDEAYDKAYGPNYPYHVATLVIGSQNTVNAGYTSATRVDHYSMLRTVDEALGLNPLTDNDKYAAPVNDVWNSGTSNPTGPLVSAASRRCLDDPGGNTANGTRIDIWDRGGAANQRWTAVSADNTLTTGGKCLDASGGGTGPGTPVALWDCNGQANQQWTFASDGTVRGVQSGLCLDVTGGATGNGTPVELSTCIGGTNEQWKRG